MLVLLLFPKLCGCFCSHVHVLQGRKSATKWNDLSTVDSLPPLARKIPIAKSQNVLVAIFHSIRQVAVSLFNIPRNEKAIDVPMMKMNLRKLKVDAAL